MAESCPPVGDKMTENNGGGCVSWLSWVPLNSLLNGALSHQNTNGSHELPDHWKDLSSYYNALICETQVSRTHILEPLSCLLLCLSSAVSSNKFHCPDIYSISICIMDIQIGVKFDDIKLLQNLLFKELLKQLQMILAAVNQSSDNSYPCNIKHSDIVLLLRCYIRILPLLDFDTSLSQVATTRLVSLFHKLCSPTLVQTVFRYKKTNLGEIRFFMNSELSCWTDGSARSFASSKETIEIVRDCSKSGVSESHGQITIKNLVHCLSAMLEVFVDEFILHPNLGKSFSNEDTESTGLFLKLKMPSICGEHLDYSLEAVFVQCLLLSSQGELSDTFTCRLFDLHTRNKQDIRISLPVAVVLLDTLLLIRAPKIFQAHALTLVCEAVSFDSIPAYGKLPMELAIGEHISVLEAAVKLYIKHYSLTDVDNNNEGLENRALESCLIKHRNIQNELNAISESLISLMWNENDCIHQDNRCGSRQNSSSRRSEGHSYRLQKSLHTYIEGCEASPDDLFRKEITSILHFIVMDAFSGVRKSDCPCGAQGNAYSGTYLLAAILQLMGSSLAQIGRIVKENGDSRHSSSLDQYLLPACYNYTTDLILNCVQQCPHVQPIGTGLNKITAKLLEIHQQSLGSVLSYFAGELYLKFQMGSELLCKGYIYVMKSLMRLLVLENGGSDVLRILMETLELTVDTFDSTAETTKSQVSTLITSPMTLNIQPRLVPLIENFLKKKRQLSLSGIQNKRYIVEDLIDEEDELDLSAKSENACMQNSYIESVIKVQGTCRENFKDLNDFIVCKKGRNYQRWLKKRCKIRKKKYDQQFFQIMRRRKELLSLLEGNDL